MRQPGVWGDGAGRGRGISSRPGHPRVLWWLCKTVQTHSITRREEDKTRRGWGVGFDGFGVRQGSRNCTAQV